MKLDPTSIATPEWTVAHRDDRVVDTNLTGGWVATPAPLGRGQSFTDFSQHIIAVPEGDSELAQGVRFHELCHARYSPSTVPASLMSQMNLPVSTVRVAEEFRINRLATDVDEWYMRHSGMSEESKVARREMARLVSGISDNTETAAADHAVAQDDFRSAVLLMFSTYNLTCFKDVKRRLRRKPEWKDAVAGISHYLDMNYGDGREAFTRSPHWSGTKPIRYEWREGFATRSAVLPNGFVGTTLPLAMTIETIIDEGGVGTKRVRKGEGDELPEEGTKLPGRGRLRHSDVATWVQLRLGMTSLTETTAKFIGRRKRPSITGKVPVRPDRLLTDPERRIFRTEVRGDGGIVVFDCSGSMGVDYEVVRNAVAQFAGATVIAYSNMGRGQANCWVLAKNGRMISAEDMEELPLNNGNGVDGLALRWAIRERRSPKEFILWVSDLGVTGTGDSHSSTLLVDCAELCRKHNIAQVMNTASALELLNEMKRTGAMPRRRWSRDLASWVEQIETGRVLPPAISIDAQG